MLLKIIYQFFLDLHNDNTYNIENKCSRVKQEITLSRPCSGAFANKSDRGIMFDFWRRCDARGSRGLFPKSDFPRIISIMSNYRLR